MFAAKYVSYIVLKTVPTISGKESSKTANF